MDVFNIPKKIRKKENTEKDGERNMEINEYHIIKKTKF